MGQTNSFDPLAGGAAPAFGGVQNNEELLAPSGASVSTSGLFPAGCQKKDVTGFVKTTVTGAGVTGFDVGDGFTQDLYAANVGLAAGTAFSGPDHTGDPEQWIDVAGEVVLTPIGGTFSGGQVRIRGVFELAEAPTS